MAVKVLGIETSCDETAAAVVEDGSKMLSNTVASSLDLHIPFGGVVPEIAARSHIEVILPTIEEALGQAKTDWGKIDAIAVTQGPGLLGSLLIGVLTARMLAIAKNKPLYAINHVDAHPYACFITDVSPALPGKFALPKTAPKFPTLAMVASGGHTQLMLLANHKKCKIIGQTTDDAVGEAFDKVAKLLGLPYPGGPSIADVSQKGDATRYNLPVSQMPGYDFSFSGLKTAVLRTAQDAVGGDFTLPSTEVAKKLNSKQKADLAASFQKTAVETLMQHLKKAEKQFKPKNIIISGGVAANLALREAAKNQLITEVIYPKIKLCTDNAAMVASLAYFKAKAGQKPTDPYKLEPEPGLMIKYN